MISSSSGVHQKLKVFFLQKQMFRMLSNARIFKTIFLRIEYFFITYFVYRFNIIYTRIIYIIYHISLLNAIHSIINYPKICSNLQIVQFFFTQAYPLWYSNKGNIHIGVYLKPVFAPLSTRFFWIDISLSHDILADMFLRVPSVWRMLDCLNRRYLIQPKPKSVH